MVYGKSQTFYVTEAGLLNLLNDIYVSEQAQVTTGEAFPVPNPLSVWPTRRGQSIRVDVSQYVYDRLLNHDLVTRYNSQ